MLSRLNKYIADSGVTSRRKSEELILQGRVEVNNKIITDLSFKVDTDIDIVNVDGEKILNKKHVYFLLNKPKGVVTTTNDEKNRTTVVDIIKTKEKIFPVGRLDYNTTGVLFLTNDGDFSYHLTHPKNNISREYEVTLDKPLSAKHKEQLLKGIYLDGKKGKLTKLIYPKRNNFKFVAATSVEGRNHFIKLIFGTLGYTVIQLNRKSFAGIYAGIPVGSYRQLLRDEIRKITEAYAR